MNKPKKPLRGLFARTEPVEEVTPAPAPVVEAPKVEAKVEVKEVAKAVEARPEPARKGAQASKKVEELLRVTEEELVKSEPKVEAKVEIPEPVAVEAAPEVEIVEPVVAQPEPVTVKPEPVVAAAVAPRAEKKVEPQPKTVVMEAPVKEMRVAVDEPIRTIQYNFDSHRSDREVWNTTHYQDFIRRIDAAQTEAFLLKGKLLDEVKRRFFEDNKVGWKRFCEDSLDMNYTTANQYIRVAQEFDVTSHQRRDFGFEHFKALLPLEPDLRNELVKQLPQMSVKALRQLVADKLRGAQPEQASASPKIDAKGMVKVLQELKLRLYDCTPDTFTQAQRWQLSAACFNLSEELADLAMALKMPPVVRGASRFEMVIDPFENERSKNATLMEP